MAVHPRACGERSHQSPPIGLEGGSSPRVRGTPLGIVAHLEENRFIPARAGNAYVAMPPLSGVPVHPRACGERLSALFAGSV